MHAKCMHAQIFGEMAGWKERRVMYIIIKIKAGLLL